MSSYTDTIFTEGPLVPVSHGRTCATSDDLIEIGLADVAELRDVFTRLTDPRRPCGIRHTLPTVLTSLVFAVLCGAGNFREAGDQVADLPALLHDAAGTRRHPGTGAFVPPSRDTIRRLVQAIDAAAADMLVCAWIAQRAGRLHHAEPSMSGTDARSGLALDGKTVRHSDGGRGDVKLFSAMRHGQAVVNAQLRVPATTNKITQVTPLLEGIDISGVVITGDAAHAQRTTTAHVCERGADYVLTVKGNQPDLLRAIADRFATPAAADHLEIDTSHGRRVHRQIWSAAADGVDFPGAAQVLRIRRDVFDALGRRVSKEVVHGITSLPTKHAAAEAIARFVRRHWGIENKIHWVRDVVFGEDAHHAYLASAAHAMACIRNLAIGLPRLAGTDDQAHRPNHRPKPDQDPAATRRIPPVITRTLLSPCLPSSRAVEPHPVHGVHPLPQMIEFVHSTCHALSQ